MGNSQNALSRDVGLSQTTVSRIISSCIRDIVNVASDYVKFPTTKEEIRTIEKRFWSRKDGDGRILGVPCYASLDGKHWACDHPPQSGSLNFNYKCFFSYTSLFLCDSDYRVIYVQISANGTNSDAQMFRDGPLAGMLKNAADLSGIHHLPGSQIVMPSFIVADGGFGLSKHVMTPYGNLRLTTQNLAYNQILSGSRVKIENIFGVLTSKFQVFARNFRLNPRNSRALILACTVIHNITVGPLEVTSLNPDEDPVIIDPYKTSEEQRCALKKFLLSSSSSSSS
uniref:DDE Tnp4 domain-containing protein n=1 Tax=Caenorhabditis japonica TaxID=281687 RepID=A0A8R1E741_CAEJA